jgi:parvulin-like peptidyl-prolyl isomerase
MGFSTPFASHPSQSSNNTMLHQSSPQEARTLNIQATLLVAVLIAIIFTTHQAHAKRPTPKPTTSAPTSNPESILIDSIVATIDDTPITLSELGKRLIKPRKLTPQELSNDQEVSQTLEALILERILEAEASQKRITVEDSESDDYINQVAAKNSLSRADFESALVKEGRDITSYKRQVRLEIIKTKLAQTITKGGVSVTDKEIDQYLSKSDLSSGGTLSERDSVKLRAITVLHAGKTPEEVEAKVASIIAALGMGREFAALARETSESPQRDDGGALGILAEEDISANILQAISQVKPGGYSGVVTSADGKSEIFFVEARYRAEDDREALEASRRELAREAVKKRKTDERIERYFGKEILANHAVVRRYGALMNRATPLTINN